MTTTLIIASGVLTMVANVPYIFSILRGKTVPNPASWWIWVGVNALVIGTYYDLSQTAALGLGIGSIIGQIVIAILAVRKGALKLNWLDRACLIGAVFASALWWMTSAALPAHIIGVFMDFLGWVPTFRKTLKDPQSENPTAWVLWSLAAGLALLAVDQWSVSASLFPLYIFISDAIVAVLVYRYRFSVRRR